MMNIGEFAIHGAVSVRMLRHYDAVGLLAPAHVDPHTGYRRYAAEQLSRLNRLVALKDLGFTLEQVGQILDGSLGADQLHGMLTLRQAQVEQSLTADRRRLTEIRRRLRLIEKENHMSDLEFTERALPALTLTQLTSRVADVDEVSEVVGPLFGRLMPLAAAAGLDIEQPSYAWYAAAENGIELGVGLPIGADDVAVEGTELGTLPAASRAVTVVHRGDMATISDTWQALMRRIEAQGLSPQGTCREVYLDTTSTDEADWVTELQQPVV